MIYIWLNILPIAAATACGLAIGYLWVKASKLRVSAAFAVAAAVAEFWLAAILAGAVILAPPQADPWIMAMGSAFIIWIGFVLPVLVVTLGARGLGAVTVTSASGYWLVTMMVQAAIMKTMGLVPPPVG